MIFLTTNLNVPQLFDHNQYFFYQFYPFQTQKKLFFIIFYEKQFLQLNLKKRQDLSLALEFLLPGSSTPPILARG